MEEKKIIVNENIKAQRIFLILSDGKKHGLIAREDALRMAEEEGLELVQVSPGNNEELPICKILDLGKLKYKQSKHNKKSHTEVTKEIYFHFNTGQHDMDIKNKKAIEFLNKNYKVLYCLQLKGREKYMTDNAMFKFKTNLEIFKDLSSWKEPVVSCDNILVTLVPRGKK